MGGIKTNISLFRRILSDPDFRAAKLDTGFLDRLLAQKRPAAELIPTQPKSRLSLPEYLRFWAILG